MMAHHENWKELVTELQLTNDDLREKLRVLGSNYDHAIKELRKQPGKRIPHVGGAGGYECGKCNTVLDDEWTYCPECGSEIDWYGEEDDWYAEEGERLLQAEVYDPIREAMSR